MPWTPGTPRPQLGRAAHQLTIDATASDERIAELAGCSRNTVAEARARLERLHIIPVIEPAGRIARPRPQRPSATAAAIAQLGADATPRQVADLASVSLQAAWKALAKVSPRITDVAAATDAISVSKMPRQLADAAAASDALSVLALITCTQCLQTFTCSTADAGNRNRRLCSDACRDAEARERGRKPRPRVADYHQPPTIQTLAKAPRWELGVCANVPLDKRGFWTSSDRAEREAAAHMCRGCAIFDACQEFSLSLPVTDFAVYAGQSATARLRAKHDRLEMARQSVRGWRQADDGTWQATT